MQRYFIQAPAKINLHLDVAEKSIRGFHPLRSIFLMVDLFDDLIISPMNSQTIEINGFTDLPLEENILYRCWHLALEKGWFHGGLKIDVIKRIPSGAGLGGGSSDCAALLKVMRLLEPQNISGERMRILAEEMGSDVPFFLDSPLAYVEGRGEVVEPWDIPLKFKILLLHPDIHISTGRAFNWLDQSRSNHYRDGFLFHKDELKNILQSPPSTWSFFNSFTPVLSEKYPFYPQALKELKNEGASFCDITGSGSTFFALFDREISHLELKKWNKEKKQSLYSVEPLEKNTTAIIV